MSDTNSPSSTPVQSPPPAPMQAQEANDPRHTLHRLASELMRAHNRKLLIEFLQLRRALR